jgi:hypothetical protein
MPQLPFSQSPMTFKLTIKEMYGCINMEIYDGLNSEIDQFDWNSHLSSLNDIDEMSSKFSNKYIELA